MYATIEYHSNGKTKSIYICTECGYELAPVLKEKKSMDHLLIASYGWPWWANLIAVAVIAVLAILLGGLMALVIWVGKHQSALSSVKDIKEALQIGKI